MAHYYQKLEDGQVIPMHYVEMASRPGELRPTRITDVRKWWKEGKKVEPSVTTVYDVLGKPALINWKIDQHLAQAYRNPDLSADDEYGYIQEIKRLTEMEMDKAPAAGSDLHKLMEKFLLCTLPDSDPSYELCQSIQLSILDNTIKTVESGMWAAKPEVQFVSDLGYSGQVDLVISNQWIIDYKTKQTKDKFKPGKMVWDEHRMQLAAYRNGLELNTAKCANIFICLEDGQIDFHEHTKADLDKGLAMFKHCLGLWQIQNNALSCSSA